MRVADGLIEYVRKRVEAAIASGKVVDVCSLAARVSKKYPGTPTDEAASLISDTAVSMGGSAWWSNYSKNWLKVTK